MAKLTGIKFAQEVLKNAKTSLTAKEIWDEGVKQGLEEPFYGKTPLKSLESILYTNRDENGLFMIASRRPTTFWLRSRQSELGDKETLAKNIQKAQESAQKQILNKIPFSERDLHPLLVSFLYHSNEFNLYCKTIYHEKSQKTDKGKDKWNHPDIVGVHLPFNDYDNKTLALLTNINQVQYRIYSFELKIQLNFSNLKEYYFQAVSNSSFAHEGYLVVYNIDDSGDELKEELSRLHLSFGIGVIKLETNPLESSVLFRARENRLDVRTLDMLVEKNRDFADFIDGINEYVKMHASSSSSKKELLKTIEKKYFDDILQDENLEKHVREKLLKNTRI